MDRNGNTVIAAARIIEDTPTLRKRYGIKGRPVGGLSALARALGVSAQAVQQWAAKGRPPARRVIPIEHVLEGRMTRHEIHPELYPLDGPPAPELDEEPQAAASH